MIRGAAAAIFTLCFAASGGEATPAASGLPMQQLTIATQAGPRVFDVEIATTSEELRAGLAGRTHLDPDAGMLFYFGRETGVAFWMKDTLIPLDILFIAADGTITLIDDDAQPNDLTQMPSYGRVLGVLEINGGRAQALGIAPGDRVEDALFGGR